MALGELQTTLARAGKQKQAAAAAFAAALAAVLLHLPMPEEMPPACDFLPLLPPGLRTFALLCAGPLPVSERGVCPERGHG